MRIRIIVRIFGNQVSVKLPQGIYQKFGDNGIIKVGIEKEYFKPNINKQVLLIPEEVRSKLNLQDKQERMLTIKS